MKKITLLLSAMLFSMMSFAGVVTFDADTDKGNAGTDSNNATAYTISKDGVTLEVSQGILGTYNNENHYRIYKNQTLKITSTAGAITSVQFTCTANGDTKYGPGCFTASTGEYGHDGGAVGTWTGSATEITFSASTNQVRASQIVVAIDGAELPDAPDTPDTPDTPEEPEAKVVTVAEFNAAPEATDVYYELTGTIGGTINTTYGNFDLTDETGTVYVYGLTKAFIAVGSTQNDKSYSSLGLKEGDKITIRGFRGSYNGKIEVLGAYFVKLVEAGSGTTPPTPPTNLVGDGTETNPYTVEDVLALNNTSKGPHYVKGFIIGQVNGASISSGLDTEAPFVGSTYDDGSVATQGTNLMIAGVAGDTTKMVAVQLPAGALRDEFNLVEHPEMLGAEILICGSLEKYFGVAGIKSPTSIILLSEVGPSNVVTVTGLQYADAYYYEYEVGAYYQIDLYKDMDPDTYEYVYPELYLEVQAKSKTALNGTYDLLYAGLWTSVNDSVEIGDAVGTVTIKNKDDNNNYSFVGSYVGTDGKTYKFNQVVNLGAYDADADYEWIELEEENGSDPGTGTDPVVPTGAIVFDADVDQGNAGTDSNNATAYTVSKSGVTLEVSSGILGTYNNEMHYRIYKNQTLTVTSTVGNIAKIEFTCTANGDAKYGPGCFTASTGEYGHDGAAVGTWTGDAATVTFTASTNQVRATQIVVTLASATAVDNVTVGATPVKVIENGQLMIIRGEKVYNVLGAQVK